MCSFAAENEKMNLIIICQSKFWSDHTRQGYQIHNRFSKNCYWLVIVDLKKKHLFKSIAHFNFTICYLNLVLTLSLIYPFFTFSEDHRPCSDTNRSVTLLLAVAEASPAWRLRKPYFSRFPVISVI